MSQIYRTLFFYGVPLSAKEVKLVDKDLPKYSKKYNMHYGGNYEDDVNSHNELDYYDKKNEGFWYYMYKPSCWSSSPLDDYRVDGYLCNIPSGKEIIKKTNIEMVNEFCEHYKLENRPRLLIVRYREC
jgi:hypothetical protein